MHGEHDRFLLLKSVVLASVVSDLSGSRLGLGSRARPTGAGAEVAVSASSTSSSPGSPPP